MLAIQGKFNSSLCFSDKIIFSNPATLRHVQWACNLVALLSPVFDNEIRNSFINHVDVVEHCAFVVQPGTD